MCRWAKKARLSVGSAYAIPGFVACMNKYDMKISKNGYLTVRGSVTPAQLDAAESVCGFDAVKVSSDNKTGEVADEKKFVEGARHTRAFRYLVAKIAACLQKRGLRTTSQGLTLSQAGNLGVSSPQVRVAVSKCRREFLGVSAG
jgi:hypothetical protein